MFIVQNPKFNCVQAAQAFAREAFESPREVKVESVAGHWAGPKFAGTFALTDGQRLYRLTCDAGTWSVVPVVL